MKQTQDHNRSAGVFSPKTLKTLGTWCVLPLLALGIAGFGTGCSNATSSSSDKPDGGVSSELKQSVIEQYADIVYASYDDSLTRAQELQAAVQAFVESPSEDTFAAAKTAWLAARVPYGQTEGYRFYSGPIDDENGPEGQLNAWPLDEVYIDYVSGQPSAGIINNADAYPNITAELLISLNEQGGDKNISTGYHAIEFLLWGQDLTEGPGAGQRAHTDYVTDGSGTNANQARRAEYLTVVTDLLVSDLQSLVDAWAPNVDGNYRSEFVSMNQNDALINIFRGIGTLSASELASERMATPLAVKEREEEHSCFSDNTHVDIVENARSVQNVFLGSYTRIDGSTVSGDGLYALIQSQNASLAEAVKTKIETSMTAVNAIQPPFDQEILASNPEGNTRVTTAVEALQEVGEGLVEAAAALGLSVNTELE